MLINICKDIEVLALLAISPYGQLPGGTKLKVYFIRFFGFD